jgi:hypothetical protein
VSSIRRSIRAAATAAIAVAPLAMAGTPALAPVLASGPFVQAPMHLAGSATPFFVTHGGGTRNATVTSTNWSGYAATGSTYTSVATTFTEPAVKCSSGDQYSSFWVGLDGYSSSSVEQTGTEADCAGKTAEYSAWYELYPAAPVTYSNTVKPGDVITVTIAFSGTDTYTLTTKNATEGWTKTTKKNSAGDARSSAEIIAEAPYSGGVTPIATFSKVTFTGCEVDGATLGSFDPTAITSPGLAVSPITNGTVFSITQTKTTG